MKLICVSLIFAVFILSCNSPQGPVVNKIYVDSLISHYSVPSPVKTNAVEMQFWKNKITQYGPDSVYEQNYANSLLMRFHLSGDIRDLTTADSLIRGVNKRFGKIENGLTLSLAGFCLLLHKYPEAREWIELSKTKERTTVDQKAALLALEFDFYFESGQYDSAAALLPKLRIKGGYPYFFRLSRIKDQQGITDSAIVYMLKAADLARTNDYLKQLALSNAAIFYIHQGNWQRANELYMLCISLNPSDFHSILGLGWLALKQDQDDSLSGAIFHFVQDHFFTPDPLYKLSQAQEAKADSILEKKYASDFAFQVEDSAYGNIYNKYLIDLYTGILDDPAKAEAIAEKEILNRPNAQSFSWYAWTLLKNNKKSQASQVFEQHVSGNPLEATESYWMGILMKSMAKNAEAAGFFESARKKQFDLSPGKEKELEKDLK
jgi:tetratricopeptide (TPR) repeat protein